MKGDFSISIRRLISILAAIGFLLVGCVQGQVALVQGRGSANIQPAGSSGTRSLAFSSNNAAGDLLIVFWAATVTGGLSGSVITVSDTNNNTYVSDLNTSTTNGVGAASPDQFGVFSCRSAVAGANTVTVNSSITSVGGFGVGVFLVIAEASGVSLPDVWTLDPAGPLTQAGTGTPPTTPTLTTTIPNVILVGHLVDSETPFVNSPWSQLGVSDWSVKSTEIQPAWDIATSTGSYSGSWTTTSGDVWMTSILAYGGALPPTTLPSHMVVM